MKRFNLSNLSSTARASFGVAILFLFRFPTYTLPQESFISNLIAVAAHLLIFPVVAALKAPQWAKAAGW